MKRLDELEHDMVSGGFLVRQVAAGEYMFLLEELDRMEADRLDQLVQEGKEEEDFLDVFGDRWVEW